MPADAPATDWFHAGLRFSCTRCGNCCSGPEGYVLFTPDEAAALARRLNVTVEQFLARYTHDTRAGRSLLEVPHDGGLDCVFLDRTTVPGRAVCSVYEDRPAQCRTWPFWKSNLRDEAAWRRAAAICPGIGAGPRAPADHIRLTRERVEI